jgi:hypothetical protein
VAQRGNFEGAASAAQAKRQERFSVGKVDSRTVKQKTRAIEEKRRWAATGRASRNGRVYDEEDPGRTGEPTIPDYFVRDFDSNRGGDGTEQEDTMTPTEGKRIAGRAQGLVYWLIVRNEHGRIEVLTLDCKKTLPVFSHEEEAEMFLRLEGVGEGWQVNESRGGELVSMLYGPCTGVKEVALDPLPEMVADRTVGLVSLDRERFIRGIMARKRFSEPDRGSSPREVERKSEAYLITVQYHAGGVA